MGEYKSRVPRVIHGDMLLWLTKLMMVTVVGLNWGMYVSLAGVSLIA